MFVESKFQSVVGLGLTLFLEQETEYSVYGRHIHCVCVGNYSPHKHKKQTKSLHKYKKRSGEES